MDELHDIKPLEPIFVMPWWAWVLAAVLVVKVCVLVWLLRRRRTATVVSPRERLLTELAMLTAPADVEAALVFQTRLAALLRAWVELRFGVAATDMTSEELQRDLALGRSMGATLRGEFLDLLALADAARFARSDVALDRHAEALRRARAFVDATQPPPETAA
jgi:hypothetical protein